MGKEVEFNYSSQGKTTKVKTFSKNLWVNRKLNEKYVVVFRQGVITWATEGRPRH